MVNLDPHHRRIRNKTRWIHLGMIPLAIVVPVTWIYFAYGVCQETESRLTLQLCTLSHMIPLLPALVGAIGVAFVLWELVLVGIKHHEETHPPHVSHSRLAHAVHGYHAIDARHRRHVHWAVGQVVLVSVGLLLWLMFEIRRSTH